MQTHTCMLYSNRYKIRNQNFTFKIFMSYIMHSVRWSFSYKSVFISGLIILTTNSDSDSFLCTDWETNVYKECSFPGDDNTVFLLYGQYTVCFQKRGGSYPGVISERLLSHVWHQWWSNEQQLGLDCHINMFFYF